MHLGAEGAWLAGCLLLVGVGVCVGEAQGVGEIRSAPGLSRLMVPMPKVVKPGPKSVARQGGMSLHGYSRGGKLAEGGAYEDPNGVPGEGVDDTGGNITSQEFEVDRSQGGPAPSDNVVANNVALISWIQASESHDPQKKRRTVGALIATNAIVCAPSMKVPVLIQNTSNWNVHQVEFIEPPATIDGKNVIVVYHPDFTMDKDLSKRIALIMLLPEAEQATRGMVPIKMVAVPFLPILETTRHDDYSLANCVMVVESDGADGVHHIDMSAVMCRHNKNAKKAFQDRICAYTKMTQHPARSMVRSVASPRDMGSPLICGNLLVGIYAGIQNIRGTYHKEAGIAEEPNIQIGGKRLSNDEQYTFEIPGAPKNFEFLSAFVNEEKRKMRWEQKLNLRDTNECLVNQTRNDLGATGPMQDGQSHAGAEVEPPDGGPHQLGSEVEPPPNEERGSPTGISGEDELNLEEKGSEMELALP